jgi:putative heme-binding domain-containing protein
MVKEDDPAVRTQAATALGQIGDARANAALLTAAANTGDRFVEHAITYALIRLKDSSAAVEALKRPEPKVRKAALIALDQMEGSPLRRQDAIRHLGDANPELRRAAMWVVSHHSDWGGAVLGFLQARLRAPQFSADEADSVREALLAFCADPAVQTMVASLLADPGLASERQLFLLETIDRCPLKQIPGVWVQQFSRKLKLADERVRSRIIALVHSRGLRALDEPLKTIASDASEPDGLRTAALGVLVSHHSALDDASFSFLLGQLQPGSDAALRLSAAQVLAQAGLKDEQLLVLANQHLPGADALILSTLLDAFQTSRGEVVGNALVAALLKPTVNLNVLGSKRIDQLFQNFPEPVQSAAKPLLARFRAEQASRVEHLRELQPLLTAGGDVGHGRNIFFGKKVACSSCHTIGAEGGHVGPDLTSVGSIRSGHDLLEAIVFPSASFVPGHEVYRVKTKTPNEIVSGVIGEQEADAVILVTGPNAEVRIPRDQIASMEPSKVSLMPEGLDTSLTRAEFTDLLAFLQAQR